MAVGSGGPLARLWDGDSVAGLTDGQLLDRFATRRGSAAEAAFAALVERHGPMVARVCRARLRDEHDAEDAFQATFLVLARRAGSIGERDLLGAWLYGVAHRVARKARAVALRRRGREGGPAPVDPPDRPGDADFAVDLAPVLHEEVDRLPEKYRRPVVLCHLQGLTHAQAAQELAWPVGTVSVRLARARQILADRLARRGITASAGLVATALAAEASAAALPLAPSWAYAATAAALASLRWLPLSAATAAGAASAPAAALARRTSMTLLLAPWKWLSIPAAVALATAAGTALVGPPGPGDGPQTPATPSSTQVGPGSSPSDPRQPRVSFTSPRQFPSGAPAGATMIRGTLADLPATVERLQGSSPQTPYKLYLDAGSLPVSDPSDPFARTVKFRRPSLKPGMPDMMMIGQAAMIQGTLADLAMTARGVQESGPDMPYQLVLSGTNGTPEAKPPGGIEATKKPEPPQPKKEEPQEEIVPPLIRLPRGGVDLGPNPPAGYFDLPKPDPNNPNTPRPVQVGQKLQIETLEALPGRPLTGIRVVRPDGTISLGFYGDLPVAGFNRDQIKVKLIEKLRYYLLDKALGLVKFDYSGPVTKATAVPPLLSDRVFVDDQPDPTPAAPTPAWAPRPKTPAVQPTPAPAPSGTATNPPAPARAPAAAPRLDAVLTGDRLRHTGQAVFYRLAVTNAGAAPAANVRVVVRLPSQGGRLPRVLDGARFDPQNRTLNWVLAKLNPGETFEQQFPYDTATPGSYRCTLEAAAGDLRADAALVTEVAVANDPGPQAAAAGDASPVHQAPPVEVGQTLVVEALEALPGRPIAGERVVRPDGTIGLGFYGDVPVAGLTRDEVKVKVIEHLRKYLTDEALGLKGTDPRTGEAAPIPPLQSDRVFVDRADFDPARVARGPGPDGRIRVGQLVAVEVLEALPGRPIAGWRQVGPDGRINLGFYGDVDAAGLTRAELKAKVIEHLRGKLNDEQLGLIADDARGDRRPVAPADSTRVAVDDVVPDPEPEGEVERLRREVAELNSKLNGVYLWLNRPGRDRPEPAASPPAPAKP